MSCGSAFLTYRVRPSCSYTCLHSRWRLAASYRRCSSENFLRFFAFCRSEPEQIVFDMYQEMQNRLMARRQGTLEEIQLAKPFSEFGQRNLHFLIFLNQSTPVFALGQSSRRRSDERNGKQLRAKGSQRVASRTVEGDGLAQDCLSRDAWLWWMRG